MQFLRRRRYSYRVVASGSACDVVYRSIFPGSCSARFVERVMEKIDLETSAPHRDVLVAASKVVGECNIVVVDDVTQSVSEVGARRGKAKHLVVVATDEGGAVHSLAMAKKEIAFLRMHSALRTLRGLCFPPLRPRFCPRLWGTRIARAVIPGLLFFGALHLATRAREEGGWIAARLEDWLPL